MDRLQRIVAECESEVDQIDTEIGKCDATKNRLQARKAKIEPFLKWLREESGIENLAKPPAPKLIGNVDARRLQVVQSQNGFTLAARILQLLAKNPTKPFTSQDVMKAMGTDEKAARTTLARLSRESKIEKLALGKYCSKSTDGSPREVILSDADKPAPVRVMELLSAQPKRSFSVREIAAAMKDVNPKTLNTAIARMKGDVKIVKTGRGQYRAG